MCRVLRCVRAQALRLGQENILNKWYFFQLLRLFYLKNIHNFFSLHLAFIIKYVHHIWIKTIKYLKLYFFLLSFEDSFKTKKLSLIYLKNFFSSLRSDEIARSFLISPMSARGPTTRFDGNYVSEIVGSCKARFGLLMSRVPFWVFSYWINRLIRRKVSRLSIFAMSTRP